MKEFLMLFRRDPNEDLDLSPEEMQLQIKKWQDWIGGIAAQGKFIGTNALANTGKTVHPDAVITDGPYAEVKEIIGGYLLVKTDTLDDAVELSKGCPGLLDGGTVEVRDVMVFDF